MQARRAVKDFVLKRKECVTFISIVVDKWLEIYLGQGPAQTSTPSQ